MFKYGIPIFAAIILSLASVAIVRSRTVHASVPPPSAPPAAAFSSKVGAVGLVEAASENIAISLPVSGLVTSVSVKAGDHVAKGQRLFSLDDRDLRAELALRQSALTVSQAKLEKLRSMPRPEDIPPAEARVREAQELVADAQVQFRLMDGVRDKRAIREEDLQRRKLAVAAAQARLDQSEAELKLLQAGSWAPEIKIAEAEVAQAQSQIARTQADIDRLTVTAPIAGNILQCKVRVGEFAQSGPLAQPLILLGSNGELHVRADVDEQDASRVNASAPAIGSPRGDAAHQLKLRFVRFEPYVIPKKNLTGDSTERVDTRVLQVIYALDRNAPVYAGQQMDVFIEVRK
jgi:multidrug efflux pump subunit AcrA (membrane-fusion protein)